MRTELSLHAVGSRHRWLSGLWMRQEDCSTLRDPQQKMLDGRTPELHVQSSAHYKVHITYGRVGPPVAALRCYALPVLWMTSYLHIMAWDRRREKDVHSKRLSRGSRIWHRDVRLNWPTRGSTGSRTESDIYNFLVEKIVDVFWNSANSYLQSAICSSLQCRRWLTKQRLMLCFHRAMLC